MGDKIQKSLDEVIDKEIQHVSVLEVGSDERSKAIAELERLHRMRVEEAKVEVEFYEKKTRNENEKNAQLMENCSKAEQIRAQNLDRWVNLALQLGIAVGGWVMYSIWQASQQKFELEGTPSNTMFRNLLGKMTPKIK